MILKSQVNNIPVLDKDKKVIGMLRSSDILDVIYSFMENSGDPAA